MQACTRTVSWVRRMTLCFFPLDLTTEEANVYNIYFYNGDSVRTDKQRPAWDPCPPYADTYLSPEAAGADTTHVHTTPHAIARTHSYKA